MMLEAFRMGFLPAAVVARRLHVSVASVQGDCRTGVVPAVKVGAEWRIPASYLQALLDEAYARAGRVLSHDAVGSG